MIAKTKGLCEICSPKQWKTISTDMLTDGGYPVYGANGVIGCYSEYNHEKPTLLITCRGATCGTLNICEPYSYVNGNAMALDNLTDEVDIKYLYYYLLNRGFEDVVTGSAQPQIVRQSLQKVNVTYPDKERQAEIVTVLEKASELIALRKKQLAKLDQLVKSRFIEMFGDPVLNQHGWQKAALEANATLLNGRAYKQDELLDSGKYPVLRVGNFFSNRGWYYSDLELDDDKYCDNGDLLYAWSASFGPQIWNGGKVIYHYHIWKVLVGEAYNKQFLCKLLEYATESLMGDTHGIAMMHLTKSGMEKTEFIVPPIELQEQFAAFVEQTDKSKLAIQQSLDKLETLKKSLMQEYFE